MGKRVKSQYRCRGERMNIENKCMWKITNEKGSVSDKDCTICTGYNDKCEKYYSNHSRQGKKESDLYTSLDFSSPGDKHINFREMMRHRQI
jgi:hypothetical protein